MAAALVAVRAVAAEAVARRAAPALVVLPAAVWAGTSLDALFAGLAATGVALATVAAVRSSRGHALGAGMVLGVALLFSYGAVLMVVVAAAATTALAARADRPVGPVRLLVPLAAGVLLPLGLAGMIAGFWWIEGLQATGHAYWSGVSGHRPGAYLTLVGNPAALALATGPAVAAGLTTVLAAGHRLGRLLPSVVLAAVVVANLSGDVERRGRAHLVAVRPVARPGAPGDRQGWLAAQAGLAFCSRPHSSHPGRSSCGSWSLVGRGSSVLTLSICSWPAATRWSFSTHWWPTARSRLAAADAELCAVTCATPTPGGPRCGDRRRVPPGGAGWARRRLR